MRARAIAPNCKMQLFDFLLGVDASRYPSICCILFRWVSIADELLLLLHFQEEQFAPCARPRVHVGRILYGRRGLDAKKVVSRASAKSLTGLLACALCCPGCPVPRWRASNTKKEGRVSAKQSVYLPSSKKVVHSDERWCDTDRGKMHFCERDREVKNAICCFVSTNYSIMSLLLSCLLLFWLQTNREVTE